MFEAVASERGLCFVAFCLSCRSSVSNAFTYLTEAACSNALVVTSLSLASKLSFHDFLPGSPAFFGRALAGGVGGLAGGVGGLVSGTFG